MRQLLLATLVLASACMVSDPTVTMAEDQWSTDATVVSWSSRGVPIMITNATDEDQTYLVINLWEGDIDDLPLTPDGLLDLSMANISFSAERAAARYGLVHPEGAGVALPILGSGQSTSITIGPSGGPNPGTYLVISGDPNAVSIGKYARFEIGEPTT